MELNFFCSGGVYDLKMYEPRLFDDSYPHCPAGEVAGCFMGNGAMLRLNPFGPDWSYERVPVLADFMDHLLLGKPSPKQFLSGKVAFSSISHGSDKSVHIYDSDTWLMSRASSVTLPQSSDLITLAWGDSSETSLLLGFRNGSLHFWDSRTSSRQTLLNLRNFRRGAGSLAYIRSLESVPHGVVLGYTQGQARDSLLCRMDMRFRLKPVCVYEGHNAQHYVSCMPDIDLQERVVTACGVDGVVRIWDLATGALWKSVALPEVSAEEPVVARCRVSLLPDKAYGRRHSLQVYCASRSAVYRVSPREEDTRQGV